MFKLERIPTDYGHGPKRWAITRDIGAPRKATIILRNLFVQPIADAKWLFAPELDKLYDWRATLFQGTTDLWGEIKWVWREGGWLGRAMLITSSGCLAGEIALIAFAASVVLA